MPSLAGLPTCSDWLNDLLLTTGVSRAALARNLGRSREEVTRWTSGREQIPRVHLAEIGSQFTSPSGLSHALSIKDCEDLADKIWRYTNQIAKSLACDPDQAAGVVASTIERVNFGNDARYHIDDWVHGLSMAVFAVRTWAEFLASRNNDRGLIHADNIARHLRYPANYYIGAMLGDVSGGAMAVGRELGVGELRALVRGRHEAATIPLIGHHALHMLARYGDEPDRQFVTEVINDGTRSCDPLTRKLGYCGLIMAAGRGEEAADEYVYYLSRDSALAEVDLAFDATHYGDLVLDTDATLRVANSRLLGLAENIVKHYENPDEYSQLLEVDAFRMMKIFERNPPKEVGATIMRRLRACLETDGLPEHGTFSRVFRRAVESASLYLESEPNPPLAARADSMHTRRDVPEFDLFLAHNHRDQADVLLVATALKEIGVKCWFDQWRILPGEVVQEVIQRDLPRCRVVAVFLGSDGIGKWERFELLQIISLAINDLKPIIPVVLTGATFPGFCPPILREFHSIFAADYATPQKLAVQIRSGLRVASKPSIISTQRNRADANVD